jgi:hypothetical protein
MDRGRQWSCNWLAAFTEHPGHVSRSGQTYAGNPVYDRT